MDCHGFQRTKYHYYLLSRQGRTQQIYSVLNIFLKIRGQLRGCSPPNCGISWQDLSASLRNKSCKRLKFRPKLSVKPCYTNWTIK